DRQRSRLPRRQPRDRDLSGDPGTADGAGVERGPRVVRPRGVVPRTRARLGTGFLKRARSRWVGGHHDHRWRRGRASTSLTRLGPGARGDRLRWVQRVFLEDGADPDHAGFLTTGCDEGEADRKAAPCPRFRGDRRDGETGGVPDRGQPDQRIALTAEAARVVTTAARRGGAR